MLKRFCDWPYPFRDPEQKSDPVEMLVDITFVLALAMAGSLMRHEHGLSGIMHAVAAMVIVAGMWARTVDATSVRAVNTPAKLLSIVQTGLLLAIAVTLPEAFHDRPGGLDGPTLFAVLATLNGICGGMIWYLQGAGYPELRMNTWLCIAAMLVYPAAVWVSLIVPAWARAPVMLAAWPVSLFVAFTSTLPVYKKLRVPDWMRFGLHPDWMTSGVRSMGDRFFTAYTVACCLSLEMLEQVGQSARISPAPMALIAMALVIAYLLFQLYCGLVDPAVKTMDVRNDTVGLGRKQILNLSYQASHIVMFGGLVVASGALRQIFTELAAYQHGGWGGEIKYMTLVELCAGIGVCLLAQAWFSAASIWRLDPVRLLALPVLAALVPLLAGTPALVAPLAVVALLVVVQGLERTRERRARRELAATRLEPGRISLGNDVPQSSRTSSLFRRVQAWPKRAVLTRGDHEVTNFELLFDVMAAFAFSQTDNLVLADPTPEGVLRGLLVLAAIWGCWLTFVCAANRADADSGPLRVLHLVALTGFVFVGLAIPRAFTEAGFSSRVALFCAAYLLIRAASAVALWLVEGDRAGWRPVIVFGASLGTVVMIHQSVLAAPEHRIPFWIAGLSFEVLAAGVFLRSWSMAAPGHLAERYGVVVIIGLDMALGGMGQQMVGEPIGREHLILIGLAIASCTMTWWLYFDLLGRYAEHRLHHADPARDLSGYKRLVYVHYALLHLAVLAGMTGFALGLRAIARALRYPHPGQYGPDMTTLWAFALGGGLAVYYLAIALMWFRIRNKIHTAHLVAAATSFAAIPFLIGRPALLGLLALVLAGPAILLVSAVRKRSRAERLAVNAGLAARSTDPGDPLQPYRLIRLSSESEVRRCRLKRRFEALDTDNDGVLTWNDYDILNKRLHPIVSDVVGRKPSEGEEPPWARTEHVYRQFWDMMCRAMDRNGDQIITQEEFMHFMNSVDADPHSTLTLSIEQGDGDCSTIDSDGFVLLQLLCGNASDDAIRLFRALDKDRDGLVDLADLVAVELYETRGQEDGGGRTIESVRLPSRKHKQWV